MKAEVILDTTLERDIDLLIIEEFISSTEFASIFLNEISMTDDYTIEKIFHSKRDVNLGESDIVIILKTNDQRFALHIEDKIDAQAMPNQHDRYGKRIEKDIQAGEYDCAAWMLVAPKKYIQGNSEAKKYKHVLTYERLWKYFSEQHDLRSQYKMALIDKAIKEQKKSYQLNRNEAAVDFCTKMNQYQIKNYSSLPLGTAAWWPHRKTPIKNVQLVYKPNKGYCDLKFSGNAMDKYRELLPDYLSDKMFIASMGKSYAVRVYVSKFSLTEPFSEKIEEVEEALEVLQNLYDLSVALARLK